MFTVGTAGVVVVLVLLVVRHKASRPSQRHLAPRRVPGALAAVAVGLALVLVAGGTPAGAAPAPVGLGTAATFAVLGGAAVTNSGPSVISGDVGVSPGTAITGFPPGVVVGGTVHSADAVAAQAQADVTTAYNDAAGRPADVIVTADLGGQTLVSGVYSGETLGLTGTLTLDAQEDPDAVWVFQSDSTLITASSSTVNLIGGANPCNVIWQVGSAATLGTGTVFVGTILALAAITVTTATTVEGRLFARTEAVTLDSNVVTAPDCDAGPGPTTTSPPTTGPVTTGPSTTAPVTTMPVTTMPATTLPPTTGPATTLPGTTMPPTTGPATTLPGTTLPPTTLPATTLPPTTLPPTTLPATTLLATTLPAPTTTLLAPSTTALLVTTTAEVLGTTSVPGTSTTVSDDSTTTGGDDTTSTSALVEGSTSTAFGPTTMTPAIDLTTGTRASSPGLPVTGTDPTLTLIAGLGAVGVGTAMVLIARRRSAGVR